MSEAAIPNITEAPPAGAPAAAAPSAPAAPAPNLTASAPPPAGAPAAPIPTDGIKFPDNWKEGLPKEFQNDPAMKLIADIPTLAKSYLSGQKLIGAEKIAIPSKHATDDDWKGVFTKLGLPAELKDYALDVPKDAPFEKDTVEGFKAAAHGAGILPKQAAKVLEWYGKNIKGAIDTTNTRNQETVKAEWDGLRQEWGQAFDQKVLAAQTAFRDFADPEVTKWLNESKLGNSAKLVKIFAKIGDSLKEASIKGGGTRDGIGGVMDPATAKAEIKKIMGNMEHPYFVKGHANHNEAVEEVKKLNAMAYPTFSEKA